MRLILNDEGIGDNLKQKFKLRGLFFSDEVIPQANSHVRVEKDTNQNKCNSYCTCGIVFHAKGNEEKDRCMRSLVLIVVRLGIRSKVRSEVDYLRKGQRG